MSNTDREASSFSLTSDSTEEEEEEVKSVTPETTHDDCPHPPRSSILLQHVKRELREARRGSSESSASRSLDGQQSPKESLAARSIQMRQRNYRIQSSSGIKPNNNLMARSLALQNQHLRHLSERSAAFRNRSRNSDEDSCDHRHPLPGDHNNDSNDDCETGLAKYNRDYYIRASAAASASSAFSSSVSAASATLPPPNPPNAAAENNNISEMQPITLCAHLVDGESERRRIKQAAHDEIRAQAVEAQAVVVVVDEEDVVPATTKSKNTTRKLRILLMISLLAVILMISIGVAVRVQVSKTSETRKAFTSTQELYDAVDAYQLAASAMKYPEQSRVAKTYGYPINAWNVSLLKNFSRVFASPRGTDDDDDDNGNTFPTATSYFNEDISNWDVSNAETMFAMFAGTSAFQANLSTWSVGMVHDFVEMFAGGPEIVGDLSNWDTSNAVNMDGMFLNAGLMHGVLASSSWDTSRVKGMSFMFEGCFLIDANVLDLWNTSSVVDMRNMFASASYDGNFTLWDTSKVESMDDMFKEMVTQSIFDVSTWDTGNVKSMSGMVRCPVDLHQTFFSHPGQFLDNSAHHFYGLEDWNVSRVENMDSMFFDNEFDFDLDLSGWDTSRVTEMSSMFARTCGFTGTGLEEWVVSAVVSMEEMFAETCDFDGNITDWDVSQVSEMTGMFRDAALFNQNISAWRVDLVSSMEQMFAGASSFDQDLCLWGSRLPSKIFLSPDGDADDFAVDVDALVDDAFSDDHVNNETSADVTDMFNGSGCSNTSDPVLPGGPFCSTFCTA